MEFHLLSDVRQQDSGDILGELRHLVYDPVQRRVQALVVQEARMGGHAVAVPWSAVAVADDDAVYLSLSSEEFDQLEPYAVGINVAPPPADLDPSTPSADFEQEPIDVPDVAPVGAAEGITSIAFTPIIQEFARVPEGSVVLDDGTAVWTTDGEIGMVERIETGDDGTVGALALEEHGLLATNITIPWDWVAEVEPGRINLSVDRQAVEAQAGR